MENLYLAHFGIKGMKWGVRRDRRRAAQDAQAQAHFNRIAGEVGKRQYKADRVVEGLNIYSARLRPTGGDGYHYGPSYYNYSKNAGFSYHQSPTTFTGSIRERKDQNRIKYGPESYNPRNNIPKMQARGQEYIQKAIMQNERDRNYLHAQESAYARYQERRNTTWKDRRSALSNMSFNEAKSKGKSALLKALESYGSSGYYM